MTESPVKNPYRPGAATTPLHLAGRDQHISRFRKALAAAPEIPANVRITGLRGVGKSVLLQAFEKKANDLGWASLRLQVEPRVNREEVLTRELGAALAQTAERLSRASRLRARIGNVVDAGRRIVTVSYEDLTFGLGGNSEPSKALSRALFDAAERSQETSHSGLVLLLDEAQLLRDEPRAKEFPLSTLLAAVNVIQEAQIPLALVLCGLPPLRANLQRARTYSERMFRGEEVGALSGNPGPARDAFVRPLDNTGVTADEALIGRVLTEVEGYPYFLQLWGAELWDASTEAGTSALTTGLLDQIEGDIYERLDREFYTGRLDVLTPSEQDLILASAGCTYPPLRVSELQTKTDKSEGNINVLMGRLVSEGVVYRTSKGVYEYTAPRFHDYLNRQRSKRSQ